MSGSVGGIVRYGEAGQGSVLDGAEHHPTSINGERCRPVHSGLRTDSTCIPFYPGDDTQKDGDLPIRQKPIYFFACSLIRFLRRIRAFCFTLLLNCCPIGEVCTKRT